ncbi:class I SAM-dependent methyltransferase [Romeria aff. gracilis LEGE 07310]|uniref:Class I SAM-dependent methyltransferase n=1 Tax=Vasconcelosia minhoensis LEGE 07310 TaxID=915328 RepID=A0A8J7AMK7_9CYAN|nr:class I SAM-dependent methyltransferase [Romeria gracilis]MBE9077229.1 class I SAM-dependent methyltransferase [Romeria aff. gracilis LEGE 07310]
MATGQDTLFERFLAPVLGQLLDREAMLQLRRSVDWAAAADQFGAVGYPDYYQTGNFHGIEGGYLSPDAAVTYDPITQYVLPPNETWVRQNLVDTIQGQPRRILDLGCGTGSTTLLLKQAFPKAEVIGLDLSPYMLAVAEQKATAEGLSVTWIQGDAAQVPFADASFDLVSASLLFHETPPSVARAVLAESHRLLKPAGEIAILDGNQRTLRWAGWLNDIFEEPYIREYASGSLDAWMGAAGFESVRTEDFWMIHQVTHGVKPADYSLPAYK